MDTPLLQPPDRVLSTLNADGSRRWLRPRPSPGTFLRWRRLVAWALIALFTALPHLRIGGKPAVLLDIVRREFTFFGITLLPTDTLLLALLLIGIFLTVFLVTAMLGRVWCGWMCPQTVYLEFVYRPIERLLLGAPGRRTPVPFKGLRQVLRPIVYIAVSAFIAHTFLAYFVGTDNLRRWIFGAPTEHPVAFLAMAITTGLMLFDFGFFREQVCIVACPYARMQSALLDRDSMIISYDRARGEPRGVKRKRPAANADVHLDVVTPDRVGDCVDCTLCVQTCPTGIDIREGLQMECVGCAQCIDACDAVMSKLGRPTGLIRYSSQRAMEGGRTRLLRPRVVVYPVLLLIVAAAFITVLSRTGQTEVQVLRAAGLPFNRLDSGEIANQVRVRITNRTPEPRRYTLALVSPPGARLEASHNPIEVAAGTQRSDLVLLAVAPASFSTADLEAIIRIDDGQGWSAELPYRLLGPTPGATP